MSGWQPIETAPTGRQRFIVIWKGRFGWWSDANAYRSHKPLQREDGTLCDIIYDGWTRRTPTHWQPLPEPPQ